jgi:glycosyltransferase involved in cell wall biosynthesis
MQKLIDTSKGMSRPLSGESFPKKIAIFLPSLEGGGAERVMINLASGLLTSGCSIDLVLTEGKGALLRDVPSAVNIVDLSSRRMIASLFPLVRYLRKIRPDILLSAMDHTNIVAIWAGKLAAVGTRVVISVHSLISLSQGGSVSRREAFLIPFARRFYPWAESCVAVSDGVAKDLSIRLDFPREKIVTIYNPVVNQELLQAGDRKIDHPWFGDSAPAVILGVGRLAREKDFPTLLSAFEAVYQKMDCRLLILGDGPERLHLQELVEQKKLQDVVQLSGFVDNPASYYSYARVFVLSSAWEGLSSVLIEAMACGTQIVATRCPGGVVEITRDGELGWLVPIGDWQAMADAIVMAIQKPQDPALLQRRAMDFSVEAITQQYLELFSVLE